MFKQFRVVQPRPGMWLVRDLTSGCVVIEDGILFHETLESAEGITRRLNGDNREDLILRFLETGRSEWFRSLPIVKAFRLIVAQELQQSGVKKRKKGHAFRIEESAVHGFRLVRV